MRNFTLSIIWDKYTEISSGCWEFTGTKLGGIRGVIWLPKKYVQTIEPKASRGRNEYASRVSWQLTNGPIPRGMKVLHTCDYPLCINPDHLFLGTSADNAADMAAKGRGRNGGPDHVRGSANGKSKLTEDQVRDIRSRPYCLQVELAQEFKVSTSTISLIRTNKIWKHL